LKLSARNYGWISDISSIHAALLETYFLLDSLDVLNVALMISPVYLTKVQTTLI